MAPHTCHYHGWHFLSSFEFCSRGDPISGILEFCNVSRAGGCWFTSSSKLCVQVEVTLLGVHMLPSGTARQGPTGCGAN